MQERWTLDENELVAWGQAIGVGASVPLVLALRGDLGTGKTTLARAIARGAGVVGHIPSPTYNLLFRYPAEQGREVVHVDLYRLEGEDEVWALGWSELPGESDVLLIEWPERAEALVPEPRWNITLTEASDPDFRVVTLEALGDPLQIARPESGV